MGILNFVWDHKAIFSIVFAAVIFIPYFALKNVEKRKAAEGIALDPEVGVKVSVADKELWLGNVSYLDGTVLPADGYGMTLYTWEDFLKSKDGFGVKGIELVEADFPLVAFFNSSTFDTTGDVIVARRAKDGSIAMEIKPRMPIVRRMIAHRDGSFTVALEEGGVHGITRDIWYRDYMGIQPPALPAAPTPTGPQLPATPGHTQWTVEVFQVGGDPALVPLQLPVLVFAGMPDPKNPGTPVLRAHTGPTGRCAFALPNGIYTVAIERQNGQLQGNALDQTVWPAVSTNGEPVTTTFRVQGSTPANGVNY